MKLPKKRRSLGPKICEIDVKKHLAYRDSVTAPDSRPKAYKLSCLELSENRISDFIELTLNP